jgi:hypothetical protein
METKQVNILISNSKCKVTIRLARVEDQQALATVHWAAYTDRFFNDKTAKQVKSDGSARGGSLREYKDLIPDEKEGTGQCLKYFQTYWEDKMKKLNSSDPSTRFYCFVAEIDSKIVGFVKGFGGELEGELYKDYKDANQRSKDFENSGWKTDGEFCCSSSKFSSAPAKSIKNWPSASEMAELGSLYILPGYQRENIGRLLTQRYAQEMQKLGYKRMVTCCYKYNDSQQFFAKMGARLFTSCKIPNPYRKANGEQGVCEILGASLYWSSKKFQALCKEDVLTLQSNQRIGQRTKEADRKKQVSYEKYRQ